MLSEPTAKALARLRGCACLSEHTLVAYMYVIKYMYLFHHHRNPTVIYFVHSITYIIVSAWVSEDAFSHGLAHFSFFHKSVFLRLENVHLKRFLAKLSDNQSWQKRGSKNLFSENYNKGTKIVWQANLPSDTRPDQWPSQHPSRGVLDACQYTD